ncbi:SHOCT domain-containing protein [Streptomyces exfoliatus]
MDGEDDVITLLERLASLREQGALTDAEFSAQKTRILAD